MVGVRWSPRYPALHLRIKCKYLAGRTRQGRAHNRFRVNFRDITTRVRHEEQMREREQQLSHYARLSIAGETAAALAHEVNQPLCAAVNFFAGCRRRLNAGNADLYWNPRTPGHDCRIAWGHA